MLEKINPNIIICCLVFLIAVLLLCKSMNNQLQENYDNVMQSPDAKPHEVVITSRPSIMAQPLVLPKSPAKQPSLAVPDHEKIENHPLIQTVTEHPTIKNYNNMNTSDSNNVVVHDPDPMSWDSIGKDFGDGLHFVGEGATSITRGLGMLGARVAMAADGRFKDRICIGTTCLDESDLKKILNK